MFKNPKIQIMITLILIIKLSKSTKHEVKNLFPEIYNNKIYSGYLKTDISGNELFYIYTPSQSKDPNKDPIILWLQGGPGGSSFLGLFTEIGPVVTDYFSNKFKLNNFSWNLNCNYLFIEQPAGVGFSKSYNISQFWNEEKTSKSLLIALKNFLKEEFPEIKNNNFYITGESYAGIFIPNLALAILKDEEKVINLKGFMIGNPLTDFNFDYERTLIDFGFNNGLISIETYESYLRNCPKVPLFDMIKLKNNINKNNNNNNESNEWIIRNVTHECNIAKNKASIEFYGNELYGIYLVCKIKNENKTLFNINKNTNSYKEGIIKNLILNSGYKNINLNNKKDEKNPLLLEPEEWSFPNSCEEDLFLTNFLNLNETKEKLNVEDKFKKWKEITELNYPWNPSIELYKELRNYNISMWILSGINDGVIPTLGTLKWIESLNWEIVVPWRQWKLNNQVKGMVQKYDKITIVTIIGAGHMAPQDKREECKKVFDSFINNVLP